MRVIVAPDKFAGTLTAVEAVDAITAGWRRRAPKDELVSVPMSDGGPGFANVLHAVLGGELMAATVPGPNRQLVPATVLRVGETAYVESAQVVGLDLVEAEERNPENASSFGLGVLIDQAVRTGSRRVIVGLGGSGTNDGGAGMLAALGATSTGGILDRGPAGLVGLTEVSLAEPRSRLAGIELIAATDVLNPLLGLTGATKTYGPQKGLDDEQLLRVDGWLQRFAELTDRKLAGARGAGAAGGIGFALLLLGANASPGVDLVAEAVDLDTRLRGADLVVTGEGAFDFSSRSGKVPYGVAQFAAEALVPCIALAGQVLVGSRETRALGIEAAYSMTELVGRQRSLDAPTEALADLSERVARTWSR